MAPPARPRRWPRTWRKASGAQSKQIGSATESIGRDGRIDRGGLRQRRARRRRRAPLGRRRPQGRRCGAPHDRRHERDPRDDPGDLQAHQAPGRELAGDRQYRRTDQRHRRADQHPGAQCLDPGVDGRRGRPRLRGRGRRGAAARRARRHRDQADRGAGAHDPDRHQRGGGVDGAQHHRRGRAARCWPRTPARRCRRSSRSPTRSRAWCRTSPRAPAASRPRRRTSRATCRCCARSAPRPADSTSATSQAIVKLADLSAALRKSVAGFRLPERPAPAAPAARLAASRCRRQCAAARRPRRGRHAAAAPARSRRSAAPDKARGAEWS